LGGAGLRPTAARLAVLQGLLDAGRPLAAPELLKAAAVRGVPGSTVYGTLSILEAAHLVRRLDFGQDFGRYEIAEELVGGHHHHFICRDCGLVDDLDGEPAIERALERLATSLGASGRRIDAHRLDLLGTCASCAGRRS
jgi:Fur family ferric uptake transcriptional regulator